MENNKDQVIEDIISPYLQLDEKVLWFKTEKFDLIVVVNAALVCTCVYIIIMMLIFSFLIKNIPLPIFLFSTILPEISGVYCYALIVYLRRKKRLNLTYWQLKNYKKIDVLTDQSFIKRDYDLAYKERDMVEHFKNKTVKRENDILFTSLSRVDSIGFNFYWKAVFFFVNNLDYSYLRIYFDTKNEMDFFLQVMNKAFSLEKVESLDPLIFKYKIVKY